MAKAKAVKSKTKTKATKGDASKPIKRSSSEKPKSYIPKIPLPQITSEEARLVCVEVLRDAYVETVKFFIQERDKNPDDTGKIESLENLVQSFEKIIIWFDKGDEWLRDLHSGELTNHTQKSGE
jgi:hypothetical protein